MKSGFDRLAKPYRWMEYLCFGRALERCRFAYLKDATHAEHALVLGDGDGRFTARLLRAAPRVRVHAVDSSEAMLRKLQACCVRQGDGSRIAVSQADLKGALPVALQRERFNLVATHFFLDCLSAGEITQLIDRVRPLLTEDAQWLVSEFDVPANAMHLPSLAVVKSLYLCFRLLAGLRATELPPWRDLLAGRGWVCSRQQSSLGGLLVAEVWSSPSAPHGIE